MRIFSQLVSTGRILGSKSAVTKLDLSSRHKVVSSAIVPSRSLSSTQALFNLQSHPSLPTSWPIKFVPQNEAYVVERMGKFNKIMDPGLNFMIPFLDKVKYVQLLKEIAIEIPRQNAITKDNVVLHLDGVLYFRIRDPYKTSYGVEDPEFAITQLAQTTMRSEIGKTVLDTLNQEREKLNLEIVASINGASQEWGIECLRYEIRNIEPPESIKVSMQLQSEAERKKRAAILESEGVRQADINRAEGKKQAKILESEAEKQELINTAQGEAEQIIAAAKARAQSIELISKRLSEENGHDAATLAIAEKYISAFGELARTNNTLILPAQAGDASSVVAKALTIYHHLHQNPEKKFIDYELEDEVESSGK